MVGMSRVYGVVWRRTWRAGKGEERQRGDALLRQPQGPRQRCMNSSQLPTAVASVGLGGPVLTALNCDAHRDCDNKQESRSPVD